ncbi:putative toxin-antitoxin system toxin component, PIN family [Candidatus Woesearchaeota archaeon]|nr:putative toxin-antitoxin system toxin component, PIN family [Candidatus Woesearchaeota archaeon]
MGKTKVLLDSNIFISALGWKGKPSVIFEKCLSGELELVTSANQLDELMRVMDYPKFNFTEEQKQTMLGIITAIATVVEIPKKLNVIEEDPDDNVILETAIVGNVDYIVSGDPHLLRLEKFGRIKIVTVNEFLGI